MRVLPIVACLAALAAGQEDLRPRQGSGWAGFKPGAWVKIRRTWAVPGRESQVTTWTSRLKHAGMDTLTLEMTIKTALGLKQKTQMHLPTRGEAGPGEKQKVERMENETVETAGRRWDCTRVKTTVSGPQGRRVVTDWTGRRPSVRVKRTVLTFGPDGKRVSRQTMLLQETGVAKAVGEKKLRCLRYSVVTRTGNRVEEGKMVSSRDMPGDTVFFESVTREGRKPVLAMRLEAVAFDDGR